MPLYKRQVMWAIFHDNGEPVAGVLSWTRRDAIMAMTNGVPGVWRMCRKRGMRVGKVRVTPI